MPEWFRQGGFVMWPLLVCSIAGLTIILERVWVLQRRRVIPENLINAIGQQPRTAETTEFIRKLAETDKSVLAELVRATFAHATLHKTENIEAVQAVARQILGRMERGLTTLALVAELGPLLGLLGTVNGMVHLFNDVATKGMSDPTQISAGISEALVATFTGLSISIPTLVAYMFLRRRIEMMVLEMERHIDELITKLYP
jgi:biopolymer transport protein ExbB